MSQGNFTRIILKSMHFNVLDNHTKLRNLNLFLHQTFLCIITFSNEHKYRNV